MARSSGKTTKVPANPDRTTRNSSPHGPLFADERTSSTVDIDNTNDASADDVQPQTIGGNGLLLTSRSPALDEFLNIDGLLAGDETGPMQPPMLPEVAVAPYEVLDFQSQSWCGWMRRGVALSGLTENTLLQSNVNPAATLQPERPIALYNANLVIQSLRSFPAMMLRRETFPWFIHRQSQLLSMSSPTALPEALSDCMSIAQMFALRTPETRPFIWQAIRTQYMRWCNEVRNLSIVKFYGSDCRKMYQMSQYELLAVVQACMIYLIMCIIDSSPGSEENSPGLLLTIHASHGPPSLISAANFCRISTSYSSKHPAVLGKDAGFTQRRRVGKFGSLMNLNEGTSWVRLSTLRETC